MPVLDERYAPVAEATLENSAARWRQMIRCDSTGANFNQITDAIRGHAPDRLVLAEGDSWFDKFTPIPEVGTNLLEEVRVPFHTAVVDISKIGDESREMVRGWQARRTRELLDKLDFDAILLSAGGNDLKNLYADMLAEMAHGGLSAEQIRELAKPAEYQGFFREVVANIREFVRMRDQAKSARTRAAPIILHGYDYFQPRPAGAAIFSGGNGREAWIYPVMKQAGLTDAQMRSAADAVIDELNGQLAQAFGASATVTVIDGRGLLIPGAPGSSDESNDWIDEIHPNRGGYRRLARCCWNRPVAEALGWRPAAADLAAACPRATESTAWNQEGEGGAVVVG